MTDIHQVNQELLAEALEKKDFRAIKQMFKSLEIADVGDLINDAPFEETPSLFRMVSKTRRASVFSYLSLDVQELMLEELPDGVLTPLVNEMEADDRTKMLEELPFEIRNKILLRLSPEERKIAWQLLSYPEESVGRLMTPDLIEFSPDMKVSDALDLMRWSHTNVSEDQLNFLFVTDADGRYVGEVSLARLVTTDPPTKKVSEIMRQKHVTLNPNDDQSKAVDVFRQYDRSYFPVTDDNGILIGIVTADDVFDVAEDEATEDIQQFGGQATLEDSYFETPITTLFKKRAGWLAILFLGGTITSACLKHYEDYTLTMAWLVFFLPLIVSAGGNTGSQSASLVIRGLAVREMDPSDWLRVMWREIVVGLGLGLVLAVLGFARAYVWDLGNAVSAVVGLTVIFIVCFGAVAGAMLPFLFKKAKLDPAVISSPLLAQLIDIVGVLLFYNVAYYLVKNWDKF
jgi:magnesium transporter